MKAGWEVRQLGEVSTKIQDGAHHSPKVTYPRKADDLFPYVTSKNIRHWRLDTKNVSYVDAEFHDTIYPRCNAEYGDVLLTKDGSNTGQVTINTFDEPISLLSSVCLIKTDSQKLDSRFLVYYLQSDLGFENITGQMTGAAIKRIILKRIKASQIPLPPLAEQRRIVAVLDEAFEGLNRARENTETNLVSQTEIIESAIQNKLFGTSSCNWIEKRFDEFCVLKRGYDLPTRLRREGKYALVTSSGITDTHSEAKVEGPGIATGRSGSIGKVHYVEGDFWPLNTALYVKEYFGNDIRFMWYFLRGFDLSRFASGAGVPTLNRNTVHAELVRVPTSLKSQIKIRDELDELNAVTGRLAEVYQTKLVDLEDLRQSLLQKAFAGELT